MEGLKNQTEAQGSCPKDNGEPKKVLEQQRHDHWKSHSFDYMDLCQQSDVSAF